MEINSYKNTKICNTAHWGKNGSAEYTGMKIPSDYISKWKYGIMHIVYYPVYINWSKNIIYVCICIIL